MNHTPLGKISDEKILELWVILEKQSDRKYTFDEVHEIAQNLVGLHLHLARIHTDRIIANEKEEEHFP